MTDQIQDPTNPTTGEVFTGRFRSRYDGFYARKPVINPEPSRTKQEFKEECDINNIWANFVRTGHLDESRKAQAQFLDLAALPDSYHDALNLVIGATQAFSLLPSDIRAKYGNSVSDFMEKAYNDPDGVIGSLAPQPPVQPSLADPATTTPDPASQAPIAAPVPLPINQ